MNGWMNGWMDGLECEYGGKWVWVWVKWLLLFKGLGAGKEEEMSRGDRFCYWLFMSLCFVSYIT